jgi:hypothetical protein
VELLQYWAALGVTMPSGQDLRDLYKLDCPQNLPRKDFDTFAN